MNIEIIGYIDAAMADRVRRQLSEPAETITLIVESEGGDFDAAMDIYATLLAHPARKVAFIGQASSGAVLIAMGADTRVAVADAAVLLHRARRADGKADPALLSRCDREIALVLEGRTGTPASAFLAEMATEEDAPLEWCRSTGIIHEIKEGA